MDAKQFDDLSRILGVEPSRRSLLAGLGSGLLALLAPATNREAAAVEKAKRTRKKRKKRKNDRKKERCKQLGDGCTPGGKRKCCGELTCSTYSATGVVPPRCCKEPGEPCTKFDDCCSLSCFEGACLDT